MANYSEAFENAINAKTDPMYMTDYQQIRDAYKEKYGERGMIGKLASIIGGRQEGIKAKDDKPYLAARRTIERYERGLQGKGGEVHKSLGAKYLAGVKRAGEQLPSIGRQLRNNQITVTVTGSQKVTRKNAQGKRVSAGSRERSWTATFHGPDAQDFITDPSLRKILNAQPQPYPDSVIDMLEGDEDDEYALDGITAA